MKGTFGPAIICPLFRGEYTSIMGKFIFGALESIPCRFVGNFYVVIYSECPCVSEQRFYCR